MGQDARKIRAILVDDEAIPLKYLENVLKTKFEKIEVIGAYQDSLKALEMILKYQPDLVFSDIEMPKLNGLQLGERIQESLPETEIIFVTAFDQYAIQAFELYAIDYIRKPIQLKRLKSTLTRLTSRYIKANENKQEAQSSKKSIGLFNTITLKQRDGEIKTLKWRTGKAQQLFAYMLHHQGQMIYRDVLLELLWPDFEPTKASSQLYTTIYHIRKTLQKYHIDGITIQRNTIDSGYQLCLENMQIDTAVWGQKAMLGEALTMDTVETYEAILHEYKGDYLAQHDYLWAEGERIRLRQLFLNYAQQLHTFYMRENIIEKAIQVNEYVQKQAPLEEISYFNLMQLYALQQNSLAVHNQYQKLETMMTEQLDAAPSEEIIEWFLAWLKKN